MALPDGGLRVMGYYSNNCGFHLEEGQVRNYGDYGIIIFKSVIPRESSKNIFYSWVAHDNIKTNL